MSQEKLTEAVGDNARDVSRVGGKGRSLSELTTIGLLVPPAFVITTEAYQLFKQNSLPPEFEEHVLAEFDRLGAERVSVRSSAVAEDSADSSWAGQFETYLNVERDGLIMAIKKCWASASSANVRSYAEAQSAGEDELAMAVVVQKMIDSEISGVAFSVNPLNRSRDEIMIEAIYGLGELLVGGMATPDNYVVDKKNLAVLDQTILAKNKMLVWSDGQNKEVDVPDGQATQPCLNESQLSELGQLIIKIEAHYGSPQDIEWAYSGGQFYILQSRPITTL